MRGQRASGPVHVEEVGAADEVACIVPCSPWIEGYEGEVLCIGVSQQLGLRCQIGGGCMIEHQQMRLAAKERQKGGSRLDESILCSERPLVTTCMAKRQTKSLARLAGAQATQRPAGQDRDADTKMVRFATAALYIRRAVHRARRSCASARSLPPLTCASISRIARLAGTSTASASAAECDLSGDIRH